MFAIQFPRLNGFKGAQLYFFQSFIKQQRKNWIDEWNRKHRPSNKQVNTKNNQQVASIEVYNLVILYQMSLEYISINSEAMLWLLNTQ